MLEAASVLVQMNVEPSETPENIKVGESEASSASPAASGSSEFQDDEISSVETTPPPMTEEASARTSKRYSNTSSVFSRSYQSAPFGSVAGTSVPTASSYGSNHQMGYPRRPSTSGTYGNVGAEDEAELAAAVELCNFGTPRTGPVHLPPDVPPVPPLPAQYATDARQSISGITKSGAPRDLGVPPPLKHRISDERDVNMHEVYSRQYEDDDDYCNTRAGSRPRSEEEDDGVFGRMDE